MITSKSSKNIINTGSSSTSQKPLYMAKVIILGNSSVGKTSIITRYTWNGQGTFQLSHTPTIGVDFKTKLVDLKVANMKLMLWDTAGQQRFRTLTDNYYSGVSGIVLVYSVTDRKSFEQISDWMYQINSKTDQDTVKVILANKCDVGGRNSISQADQKRVVEIYQGRMLAEKYKASFLEVSAKQNINIQQAFLNLCNKMLQKFILTPNKSNNNVLVLDKKKQANSKGVLKKSNCCF